jgi:outer membrane protein assembly factor BamB
MRKSIVSIFLLLLSELLLLSWSGIPVSSALNDNTTTNITQLWAFTSDSNTQTFSKPILSNGLIYTTSWNTLYCIDASTGTLIWSHKAMFIQYVVANGYVYLNEVPQMGSQGDVACLNAANGAEIWKFPFPSGSSLSYPVIDGNSVYVCASNGSYPDFNHGLVYDLDASIGRVIWQYTFDSRADALAVSDGLVFVDFHKEDYLAGLFYTHGVYALNASTGEAIWHIPSYMSLNRVDRDPPIVQENRVYLSYNNYTKENSNAITGGGVYALDELSGALLWRYSTSTPVDLLTVANGACYTLFNSSSLYVLDSSNGAVAWNFDAGAILGPVVVADGYLYIGSLDGVYCLNGSNGEIIWNFKATGSSTTNPTLANDIIYAGWSGPMFFAPEIQHDFYALNATNGAKLWNYTLRYTLLSSPTVSGDVVYIGGSWVSTRSPDNGGPGAIVALKSSVSSLPVPTPSTTPLITPTSTPTIPELSWLIIVPLFLSILVVAVILKNRKIALVKKA